MIYRILADIIMVVHFIWILFMLWGFVLTVRGFWHREFFDKWLFRTLHLAGILFVAVLAALDKFCPLTVWESSLRRQFDPASTYPGSFIIGYIEKLIYPDVSILVVLIPTFFIALFTLIVFIIEPPSKFRRKSK